MTGSQQLANWVEQKHGSQVKKYSGEPYFNHLLRVAQMASVAPLCYEIGLCHDLLEDTGTLADELFTALQSFGYPVTDAHEVTRCVVELTDVFTSAAFPDLSRDERKTKEAERTLTISANAQTVKYADLIDNMKMVISHEPLHAEQYLRKKEWLLTRLTLGDAGLRGKALQIVGNELRGLHS